MCIFSGGVHNNFDRKQFRINITGLNKQNQLIKT